MAVVFASLVKDVATTAKTNSTNYQSITQFMIRIFNDIFAHTYPYGLTRPIERVQ